MLNHRVLAVLTTVTVSAMPASAGFQWTAANWTATPSTSLPDPTGTATITVGPTDGDMLTAHLTVTAGINQPGEADAYLTFSRTFTIIADTPGQPVSVQFHRIANGTVSTNPFSGTRTGSYRLTNTNSNFNDDYPAIFPGGIINLDTIQTLSMNPGDYSLSGQFEVDSFRSSGFPVTSDFNVAIGVVVPEPPLLLIAGSFVVILGSFRSACRRG